MAGTRLPFSLRLVLATLFTCFSLGAVEMVSGPEVTVSNGVAVIRWVTDISCGTRVDYGTSPGRLPLRATGPVGTRHEVTLQELRPDTTYHFTVGTARVPLATNSFSTGNPPATNPGEGPTPAAEPALAPRPPPARITWGNPRTLPDHFDRHGRDFKSVSEEDYAAQAWLFLVRAYKEGLPAKQDSEGVLRVYDSKTGAFAAYNPDGTTKTYFKPGRRGYFEDQPGTRVDLRKLKTSRIPQ